jgi:hypothetical protein
MAGGYNAEVAETVEVHLQTLREARRYAETWGAISPRIGTGFLGRPERQGPTP